MTDRSTAWSLTINNPTPSDEEGIALARQRGWKVEGQLEKGKEGTLHYQLMVKTPQVRFSAVKKAFPRAHIEVARNVQALQQYVTKQDTRQSDLPTSQEKYPSMSKFWELLFMKFNTLNFIDYSTNDIEMFWYKETKGFTPLQLFDMAVSRIIEDGYFVESMATNPQVRQQFKLYWVYIFRRTHNILVDKDRQTASRSESEQSIVVETHNHADENQGSEEGLSCSSGDASSEGKSYEDRRGQADEGYSEGSNFSSCEEDD